MGALVLLLRFWEPKHTEAHAFEVDETMKTVTDELPLRKHDPRSGPHYTKRQIWSAWMPYALLVVFVLAWGFPPFAAILNHVTVSFAWPGLHNEILRMPPIVRAPTPYAAKFNVQLAVGLGHFVHGRVATGSGLRRHEAQRVRRDHPVGRA